MTTAESPGVAWYFNTAGVDANNDYRWFSWEPRHEASTAENVIYAPLAGTTLVQLTANTPSIILARSHDYGFVFYANRLAAPGAPEKGDYLGRPITASVLGVAAPGADPGPLVKATAAAAEGDLAGLLPLRWADGKPTLDLDSADWPPSQRLSRQAQQTPDFRESIGLPVADQALVTDALASIAADDLVDVSPDRLLVLRNDAMDRERLRQLHPWRAISPVLSEQVTFPPYPKSWTRRVILVTATVLSVAAIAWIVAWVISRWRR